MDDPMELDHAPWESHHPLSADLQQEVLSRAVLFMRHVQGLSVPSEFGMQGAAPLQAPTPTLVEALKDIQILEGQALALQICWQGFPTYKNSTQPAAPATSSTQWPFHP